MAMVAYRLGLRGPLHFGTGRAGDLADLDPLPRSDTLAAAILSVWRDVAPQASAEDVTRLAADPPFAVSSAMPAVRIGGDWRTLLFVPPGIFDHVAALSPGGRKVFKRIRFADPAALRTILDGALPERYSLAGAAILSGNFAGELWSLQTRLRLQVDRNGGHAMPGMLYEFGAVHLDRRVRLTIIVDYHDDSIRGAVEAALALLGDEGIGGARSTGCGAFAIEQVIEGYGANFGAESGSGARLTLSLLHPAPDEIEAGLLDAPAQYTITSRGGWATADGAGLQRKPVTMIAEGAIVADLGRRRYGQSPMVLEGGALGHPVFRPGRAVTIPIRPPGAS